MCIFVQDAYTIIIESENYFIFVFVLKRQANKNNNNKIIEFEEFYWKNLPNCMI